MARTTCPKPDCNSTKFQESRTLFAFKKYKCGVCGTVIKPLSLGQRFVAVFQWFGYHIAVIGPPASGKSVFLAYLCDGEFSADYSQTLNPETKNSRRQKVGGVTISIKATQDVSGLASARSDWKKNCRKADIILYFLNAHRALRDNKRYIGRISRDFDLISGWLDDLRGKQISLYLVGTHCDLDPDYDPSMPGDYLEKFERLLEPPEPLQRLRERFTQNNFRVFLGSMATEDGMQSLLRQIFKTAQEDRKE